MQPDFAALGSVYEHMPYMFTEETFPTVQLAEGVWSSTYLHRQDPTLGRLVWTYNGQYKIELLKGRDGDEDWFTLTTCFAGTECDLKEKTWFCSRPHTEAEAERCALGVILTGSTCEWDLPA